jgi:UDP-glucose 4-epimerase
VSDGIVAITGGTGFVGQAVLDELNARGALSHALARSMPAPAPNREHIRWVPGDLADPDALARMVEGAGTVLHIAGAINAPDPAGFHAANVAGTENVIEAARKAGTPRLVLVSSLSAREPELSAYGKSKRLAEEVVEASDLDWTIVRPPAVYGPRDREIFELFRAARMGLVPMPPAGRASIMHVSDLARLLVELVPGGNEVSGRTFEPDDGRQNGWMHRELALGIGNAMGRKVWAPHLPKPLLSAASGLDRLIRGAKAKLTADRVSYMSHRDWVADPHKAVPKRLWRAEIPTPEGLRATAEWYREAGWL